MFDSNVAAHENQPSTTTSEPDITPTSLFETLGVINDRFMEELARLLKNESLSPLQFQVLRIIHESNGEGVPSLAIKNQIAHRVMDVTRVVDRLEKLGYVVRKRSSGDRRVVLVSLTDSGSAALDRLAPSYEKLSSRMSSELSRLDMERLVDLLGRLK
ncbi:MAG: MarR family transcriptional regulator [Candidatus Sumerlaeia bacterium]|nr:MarR family transcriptional regulator [Candidatus Sumerlaeia bacterium]